MPTPKKYPYVHDNEWVQPVRKNYGMACCDCGLIHRLDFRIYRGKIQYRARRDNRATAAYRKGKTFTVQFQKVKSKS